MLKIIIMIEHNVYTMYLNLARLVVIFFFIYVKVYHVVVKITFACIIAFVSVVDLIKQSWHNYTLMSWEIMHKLCIYKKVHCAGKKKTTTI